ncbi:hypothetical protein [Vibrio crassostreae]|uniref:hypothetical protein n=1 Tax=Vibrio crassostreae TaxID=246167 RepID=UPI001B30E2F2|nr:hypothetical protein [Vibrio crassostreae]
MISPKQDQFLRTLDTKNLLNGYRGQSEDTQLDQRKEDILHDAMRILKGTTKKDAKTWYIRMLKVAHIQENVKNNIPLSPKEDKFLQRRFTSQGDYFENVNVDGIMQTFQHYLVDSDIPAINNYQYEQQQPSEVYAQYQKFEQDHMETKRRAIEPNYAVESILIRDDKFIFVDLGVSGSRTEGDSMGHCGNGSGQQHQRVFSLREEQEDGTVIPRATIIGNNCVFGDSKEVVSCKIGEIKGYGNNKVSKKYRKYIGQAISGLGIFTGKIAGAYKPEVDLSLLDLEKHQAREIVEKVPTYANPFEIAALNGFKNDEAFNNSTLSNMGIHGLDSIQVYETETLAPLLEDSSGVQYDSVLSLGADPTATAFSLLPTDLQETVFSIIDLEKGEMTREIYMSDEDEYIPSMVSSLINVSPMLKGVFMGLTNTISEESYKPNIDKIRSIASDRYGFEMGYIGDETTVSVNLGDALMDVAKKHAEMDEHGNPMNIRETYSFIGNKQNEEATAHALARNLKVRQSFKSDPDIQDALRGMVNYEYTPEVTTMLEHTLGAFKISLEFQRSALGGMKPESVQNSTSGEMIWQNKEFEIVKLSEGNTSKDLERIGISVNSLKQVANYEIEREAISCADNEALSDSKTLAHNRNTEVLVVRKKVSKYQSKNVGAILKVPSDRGGSGFAWKTQYVGNIIGTRFRGTDDEQLAAADAVAEFVQKSGNVRFDPRVKAEGQYKKGLAVSLAGVVISDDRINEMVSAMNRSERNIIPLKSLMYADKELAVDFGKKFFNEYVNDSRAVFLDRVQIGHDALVKMGLDEQPDELNQVFEGATFKRNTSGFRDEFCDHLERRVIEMDSDTAREFLSETFGSETLYARLDSFKQVVGDSLKSLQSDTFVTAMQVGRYKDAQKKFEEAGFTFSLEDSGTLEENRKIKARLSVAPECENLFQFKGNTAYNEGTAHSTHAYLRGRIDRVKMGVKKTFGVEDIKRVVFDAMANKLISDFKRKQEVKLDNSFADSVLGSIAQKAAVEPLKQKQQQRLGF